MDKDLDQAEERFKESKRFFKEALDIFLGIDLDETRKRVFRFRKEFPARFEEFIAALREMHLEAVESLRALNSLSGSPEIIKKLFEILEQLEQVAWADNKSNLKEIAQRMLTDIIISVQNFEEEDDPELKEFILVFSSYLLDLMTAKVIMAQFLRARFK